MSRILLVLAGNIQELTRLYIFFERTSTGPESINQDVIININKWQVERFRTKGITSFT